MTDSATTHEGPLGSAIHVLRTDAGTIAELAADAPSYSTAVGVRREAEPHASS